VATIGLLAHPDRPAARKLAEEASAWLTERGHEARQLDGDEVHHTSDRAPEYGALDLAVSLGGDGTMLRTVDLASPYGVPVLGVNLGQLGYLTSVEPDALLGALERFLAGDYEVEARMTLDVTVMETDGTCMLRRSVLNDVVLQRPGGGHTIRIDLSVNEVPFLTYAADALILASPTGSTAYNLSARGPIVSPRARTLIVTPVAPHMLFDRSLVLDADDTVALVPAEGRPADIVVDGWLVAELVPGRTLTCTSGSRDALLVSARDGHDFHGVLKRKFGLGDR
jgi:NAD+ kinase